MTTMKSLGEPLRGHADIVTSIAFSPDGKTLASGSSDTTIRLWSTIPMSERLPPCRVRMAEVALVRASLADRIDKVDSVESVAAFASDVRTDPRFVGDLRTAALIVVGEVDVSARVAPSGSLQRYIKSLPAGKVLPKTEPASAEPAATNTPVPKL
jgi:hypothetical protein